MSAEDSHPKPIIGVCLDMCPAEELQMREKCGLLHEFEITKESEIKMFSRRTNREKYSDPDRPKADKRKTVKQFCRSSAGQKMQTAEELRPVQVLLKTTDYLFTKVAARTDIAYNIVYDYVFDRLRAIRQDMAIQCLEGKPCLTILEQCVRFHVYSDYHFGSQSVRLYDRHINEVHLRECLQSLLLRYDSLSTETSWPKARPLFESVYLVYNLGTNEVFNRYGTLPKKLREHHMVKQCFKLSVYVAVGRYYQALQTIAMLRPTILALLAATKIPELHLNAIRIMSFAYHSPNTQFPIETLMKWLCPFENDESKSRDYLIDLCANCGLNVTNDLVAFNKNHVKISPKAVPAVKWTLFKHLVEQLSLPSVLRGRTEHLFIEENHN